LKWKLIAAGLVVMMFMTVITGCSDFLDTSSGNSPAKDDYPVTVGEVKFESSPEKVAVLSPSLADVVLAMGYEIKLAARTEQCTQDDLRVLPVINGMDRLDIEQIKAVSADLVISEQALSQEQALALSEAGVKSLVLEPADTQEEIEQLYRDLGSALGGAKTGYEKGQRTSKSFFMALDEVQRLAERQRGDMVVTACYLFDLKGKAVTGDQFASELIHYSGAVNAVSDTTGGRIDPELLRLGNPNYIFCAPGVKQQLAGDPELSKLTAVQEGNVFEMAPELLEWRGNSILDAVDFMAGKMYPNLIGGTSPEASSGVSSLPAGNNPFPTGTQLKSGDSGDQVTVLQRRLIELRFYYGVNETGVPSGVYDEETQRGVQDFQYRMKMNANGVADDATLDALYKEDAIVRND
jgi:iron complex transport system substrate-binding protein